MKMTKKQLKLAVEKLEKDIADLTEQHEVDPQEMETLQKQHDEMLKVKKELSDKVLGGDKPQPISKERSDEIMKMARKILNQ